MENVTQRTAIYSRMHASFLRELAENINLSFRSHADTDKEDLVKLLNKKISPQKADTVLKMYLTCFAAKEVAEAIKPKGMEEVIIAVEKFFKTSSDCLYEVTVGSRRCDLVLFVGDAIIAIEVKSAQDQMKTALSQLSYYATWANKVYLAYDSRHRRTADRLCITNEGIGLLEFNKGNIELVYDASFNEKDMEYLYSIMTYTFLRTVAKRFNVHINGTKQDIAKRLKQKTTAPEAKTIFKNFLKTRALR